MSLNYIGRVLFVQKNKTKNEANIPPKSYYYHGSFKTLLTN